ncbi:MAG: helix-turn-helix transcriptional regulator [Helcococcus sp.]|nr:helix-turn-helix transcriptional regulator [Helcococcus sp.]
MAKFQERIRKLRSDAQITMEQLAKALGVSKSRINMWENAGTVPKEDILVKISKYFNVSVDYLLGNEKMEGKEPENEKLEILQRGLEKLDDKDLEKAKGVLSAIFDDIFVNEEDYGDL